MTGVGADRRHHRRVGRVVRGEGLGRLSAALSTAPARAWRVAGAAAIIALAAAGCAGEGQTSTRPDAAREMPGEQATVVHVVDGDTLDAEFATGGVERIRPPQIDTPEVDECGYAESAAVMEDLVLGKEVRLMPTAHGPDRDTYGRLLRAVELDGDDVGRLLVRAGIARWVPRYADEDPRLAAMYEAAERKARVQSAGFWSECGWS